MNERITIGAAALQASLILATFLARHYARPPRPRGRHRRRAS
ncbi:hypothetical protein [Streptomyces triticisoli]|nr:hypothetical protein [Streptomyces triticisoli]